MQANHPPPPLRLMADYDCWPLWQGDNLDPATLDLPPNLQARLEAWALAFDSTLNRDDPLSPLPIQAAFLRPGEGEDASFEREGHALWWALRAALPGQTVTYHSPSLGRTLHPGDDELLDLLTHGGEVCGVVWRSASDGLPNVRGINAFFRDPAGRLLFPRRSLSKTRWPGALDFSVGGYTLAGESYEDSFWRETHEELGVDLSGLTWRVLDSPSPFQTGLSCFMRLYEVEYDPAVLGPPPLNPDDFSGAEWLTPNELRARVTAGEPLKPDLLTALNLSYEN